MQCIGPNAKDADHVKALRSQHPKGGATKVAFSNQLSREAKKGRMSQQTMMQCWVEAGWVR